MKLFHPIINKLDWPHALTHKNIACLMNLGIMRFVNKKTWMIILFFEKILLNFEGQKCIDRNERILIFHTMVN
jgi:hypothetical protein